MKTEQFMWFIGDTHGMLTHSINTLNELGKKYARELKTGTKSIFDKNDTMLIAGDFGFIWKTQSDRWEQDILGVLNKKLDFSVAFIDGNHENFARLNAFKTVEKYGGPVRQLAKNVVHLRRGNIYTIAGKKIFALGGGNSCDKDHRTKDVSWWPEELVSKREKQHALDNLAAHNWNVDYVLTHVAPRFIVSELFPDFVENPSHSSRFYDPVENFLGKIYNAISYKKWICGHYHTNKHSKKYDLQILYDNIYCPIFEMEIPVWQETFRDLYMRHLAKLKGF